MSEGIKLRMDYAAPDNYEPQYDEQGRFRVFPEKHCSLKVNAEEDPYEAAGRMAAEALMPTDEELGMRKAPQKTDPEDVVKLAIIEAELDELSEQIQNINNEEWVKANMPTDKELLAQTVGQR